MAPSYSQRELYGGAITVEIPSDFIDTSTIRQVPDHQEVFLSSTTLTSLIFEINTYQTPLDIQQESNHPQLLSSSTHSSEDGKASLHHLVDPVLPPDTVKSSSITPSQKTTLPRRSLCRYPAYLSSATITTVETDKKARDTVLPSEWAASPPTVTCETRVLQLLVRMEEYGTDFCVRVNVPLKEFEGNSEAGKKEVRFGEELLERIVESLDVVSFELFGGEE